MSNVRLAGVSAVALVTISAALARAEDISTKKLLIKDNANPAKRSVLVQSADLGVQFSEADTPSANGASLHVYSATDDFCVLLPAGPDWKLKKSTWKYKSKANKHAATVKDGKLLVKTKTNVTFTLTDDGTQGLVDAQVQFGTGTKYCMRCTGNKKDDTKQFQGKDCLAAACDPEPSTCGTAGSTTTTTTTPPTTGTTSTTTTTMPPAGGIELKGALTPTNGRFNYNLTLGLAGANAACNTSFPGTHACSYAELLAAETAGDLDGLKDTAGTTVVSLWAIDGTHAAALQCTVTVAWDYDTAHTGQFGERVTLNNATGVLGPLQSGVGQGVVCAVQNWVGCCL